MDGEQKQFALCWAVTTLCFFAFCAFAIERAHQDKVAFIKAGYERVSLPGQDGAQWQKARP